MQGVLKARRAKSAEKATAVVPAAKTTKCAQKATQKPQKATGSTKPLELTVGPEDPREPTTCPYDPDTDADAKPRAPRRSRQVAADGFVPYG